MSQSGVLINAVSEELLKGEGWRLWVSVCYEVIV